MNEVITLISVTGSFITALVTAITTYLVNRRQLKIKEQELNYNTRVKVFFEFSEAFTKLKLDEQYLGDYLPFHAAAYKVMLFCSPATIDSIHQLLHMLEQREKAVGETEIAAFEECLRLLHKDLTQEEQRAILLHRAK